MHCLRVLVSGRVILVLALLYRHNGSPFLRPPVPFLRLPHTQSIKIVCPTILPLKVHIQNAPGGPSAHNLLPKLTVQFHELGSAGPSVAPLLVLLLHLGHEMFVHLQDVLLVQF